MIRAVLADLRVVLAVAVHHSVGQAAAGVADDAAVTGLRLVDIQEDRLLDVLSLAVQIDYLLGHEMVHRVDAQPLVPDVALPDRRRGPLHRRAPLVFADRIQQPICRRRAVEGLRFRRDRQRRGRTDRSQTGGGTRRVPTVAAVAVVIDEALRHGEGAYGWQADLASLGVIRQIQIRAGCERLVLPRREHVSVTKHLLQFHSRIFTKRRAHALRFHACEDATLFLSPRSKILSLK